MFFTMIECKRGYNFSRSREFVKANQDDVVAVKWRRIYALIPSALALLVSLNALWNKFAYDDLWMVVRNPFIHSLRNLPFVYTINAWAGVDATGITAFPFFRPLVAVYLMISYRIFGNVATGYHLASILVHITVTLLVFLVLKEVTGRNWLAMIAALLFAAHPVHVESVAWISGVTDPLMALFLLTAFYLYLRYRKVERKSYLILSVLFYFFAISSKETAIALPLIITFWEIVQLKESSPLKQRLMRMTRLWALYALPTAIYLFMRYRVNGSVFFTDKPYYSVGDTLTIVPMAIIKYLGLLLWPMGYKIHHYVAPSGSLLNVASAGLLLFLIIIVIAITRLKSKPLNFAIVWFFCWLALPLIAIRVLNPVLTVQERYLYLPSIGFCLAVALGIEWMLKRYRHALLGRAAAAGIGIILLATWSVASVRQNRVWYDSISLAQNNVNVDPRSQQAHVALGIEYFFERRFEEAEKEVRAALDIDPQSIEAYHALSYFAEQTGKIDQSIDYLEQVISTVKDEPRTHRNLATTYLDLGTAYARRNEFARAEESLRRAAEMGMTPEAWYQLGKLYFDNGRYDEAKAFFELSLQNISPKSAPIHFDLGQVYDRLGQAERAQAEYKMYLKLDPKGRNRDEVMLRLSKEEFHK